MAGTLRPDRLISVAAIVLAAALLTACADGVVRLRYASDPTIERLASARALTVFRFADARGDEGDNDPLRVGGVYNVYGTRLQRIMTRTPWLEALVEDLGAGFAQRGVPAVTVTDRSYSPGAPVSTPLVLGGEIRNFSTEGRFLGLMAHVSGIIRVYDQQGGLLVEKRLSVRVRPAQGAGPVYETMLNDAVQRFVRQVVTDPDLAQRLVAAR